MLPYAATILCYSEEETAALLDYLDSNGARWDSSTCLEHIHLYRNTQNDPRYADHFCISILDGQVGYCYEKWYRDSRDARDYQNQLDERFNFCTVDDFIALCEGKVNELCMAELDDIL